MKRKRKAIYDSFMVFEVDDSGERKRLNITEDQFREKNGINVLDSEMILIIVKEDLRRIYIWKGAKSAVRKRFISSRVARDLQKELLDDPRYHRCKIVSIDQGDELQEFLDTFQLESMEVTERLPDMRRIRNIERERIDHIIFKQDDICIDFQYIMKKLGDSQIRSGYEREFIIIGNHAYYVVEKLQEVLGKKQVVKKLSKLDAIPDGIFFSEDYSFKILSEKGKILAIDVLKRNGRKKGYFPFPYIFKPPTPPEDLGLAGQIQVEKVLTEEESEYEPYCKHCGAKLPEGQSICHVCGKKVV